jgi:hypothetical protein
LQERVALVVAIERAESGEQCVDLGGAKTV